MKMIKKEFPVIVEQTEGGFESRPFRREKLEKKWDKLQKEKPIYHEWHCTKCNNGTFYSTLCYKNIYDPRILYQLRENGNKLFLKDSPTHLKFSKINNYYGKEGIDRKQILNKKAKFYELIINFKNKKINFFLIKDKKVFCPSASMVRNFLVPDYDFSRCTSSTVPSVNSLEKDILDRIFSKGKENGVEVIKCENLYSFVLSNRYPNIFKNKNSDFYSVKTLSYYCDLISKNKMIKITNNKNLLKSLIFDNSRITSLCNKELEENFYKIVVSSKNFISRDSDLMIFFFNLINNKDIKIIKKYKEKDLVKAYKESTSFANFNRKIEEISKSFFLFEEL